MAASWKELHTLVHSMTPAEKGYFRKFTSGFSGASAHYVRLFNTLAATVEFSEKSIRKNLPEGARNIHSIRRFLFDQIMKSLRSFHQHHSVAHTLRQMLDDIALLKERQLYALCKDLIDQGLELAEKHQQYTYRIMLLVEKRQLLKFENESVQRKEAAIIANEIIRHANSIVQVESIKQSHQISLEWINKNIPLRDSAIEQAAQSLLEKLLHTNINELKDFNERNFLNAAISNIYYLFNEMENSIRYQEYSVAELESVDLQSIRRQLGYASAIFNLCSLYVTAQNQPGVAICINKLEKIKTDNDSEKTFIQELIQYAEILMIKAGATPETHSLEKINVFLQKPGVIPTLYYDAQYTLLVFYVRNTQWESALEVTDFLLSREFQHAQISTHVHARLLHILIHFELGNHLLLPALIRHTYRFMLRIELKYLIEKQLLLKKISLLE